MTVRTIAGVAVFNVFLLAVGASVLWGLRGWRAWAELLRLGGVAYLLGFVSLMILLTLGLVAGLPLAASTIVLSGVALVVAGVVVGAVRGHGAPVAHGFRLPGLSLFAALFLAGIVVYFEAFFRASRLASIVHEWDVWAFWMPKAQQIYYTRSLSSGFLELLPQLPSYPPGLATIQTGVFHAMGSADTVTLHVQYWFFAVGFVWAVAGLLAQRVAPAILFPVLLVVLVAPSLVERVTEAYGDLPLGYAVAGAALLVALWIGEARSWQLAAATLLLSGAMLTKREGMLFAVCVLAAAFAATWRDRRLLWRPLAAAGASAFALALPWRIWSAVHGFPSEGPNAGFVGTFSHLDRVWPSFELVVTTLFDHDLWPFVAILGISALVLASFAGTWKLSVYAGVLLGLIVACSTWVMWSNTALPFTQEDRANPIVRLTGTTILVLSVLTPLLLQHAWSGRASDLPARAPVAAPGPDGVIYRSKAAWAVVLVGLLSHPGSMLIGYSGSGLPGGRPYFPSASECVTLPTPGANSRVVVGYASSYPEAGALRDRAVEAGLDDTEIARDGCGRLRVFLDELPAAEAARALEEARSAGLEPSLEASPAG